eukprot:749481-Hanusia_phi.AAC.15
MNGPCIEVCLNLRAGGVISYRGGYKNEGCKVWYCKGAVGVGVTKMGVYRVGWFPFLRVGGSSGMEAKEEGAGATLDQSTGITGFYNYRGGSCRRGERSWKGEKAEQEIKEAEETTVEERREVGRRR